MVNWRWVPSTVMVLTPEVMVGALLQPELRAAVAAEKKVEEARRRVEKSMTAGDEGEIGVKKEDGEVLWA